MATDSDLASIVVDLRRVPVDGVIARVEAALRTGVEPESIMRKRRSVGLRTSRGTWVRIERRPVTAIGAQGWNGAECTQSLSGVAKPEWLGCVVWRDEDGAAMWRADEMEPLPDQPVGTSVLVADPGLSDAWWRAFNQSLDALGVSSTLRTATPDTETIKWPRIANAIRVAFGIDLAQETLVGDPWRPAHADLTWANVTGPQFCLFDWEDWGCAPRGLDAATLWANSLMVPSLAERVRHERREDLASQDGKIMTLFVATKILGPDAYPDDPRQDAARAVCSPILDEFARV
jgi:hypothetical protein